MTDEKDESQTEESASTGAPETDVSENGESAGAGDDANDGSDSYTVALGILSELETRLHLLKEGVIRFDDRQIAWLHAKAAELRAAL